MEKDTHKTDHLPKDSQLYQAFSLLIKDSRGVYLYRKSEKISKAFFMLTQHLEESQPVKVSLRESALTLLQRSQAFLSSARLSEDQVQETVLDLMSLASLSDIALSAQLISEANYRIITGQIQIFVSEISEHVASTLKDSSLIPSTLFDVAYLDTSEGRESSEKDTLLEQPYRSDAISPASSRDHARPVTATPSLSAARPEISRHQRSKAEPHLGQVERNNKPMHKDGDDQKNERQQLIIDTIRQKGELSIKDLTDVIKGCSEKTIQRELVSLVAVGILLKTGERRWSRYSVSN